MTDMLFEQPIELLANEQLVRLPIEDLLNACRSSPQFSNLCKNPQIWIGRVQNEYPGTVVPVGENPRDFYLRKKLFGGEIYVHDITVGTDRLFLDLALLTGKVPTETITQQVAPEIIEYDDLFVRTKQMAETLNKNRESYVIIYSHLAPAKLSEIEIIAFQINDDVTTIPGRNGKITLVDIIYVPRTAAILRFLADFKLLIQGLATDQDPVMVGNQQFSKLQAQSYFYGNMSTIKDVEYALLKLHQQSNTNFFNIKLPRIIY